MSVSVTFVGEFVLFLIEEFRELELFQFQLFFPREMWQINSKILIAYS